MHSENCNIIQDLIPLYADKHCSHDSKRLVEKHISTCEKCSAEYSACCRKLNKKQTKSKGIKITAVAAAIVIALSGLYAFYSVFSVADGTTVFKKSVCAISYPQSVSAELPVKSKINPADLDEYGGQIFSYSKPFAKLQSEIEEAHIFDSAEALFVDSSVLVLKKYSGGSCNYYFIQKSSNAQNTYIFSGMRAKLSKGKASITIPLPIHLINDERIKNKLDIEILQSMPYEYGIVQNESLDPIKNAKEGFIAFYNEIGCRTVSNSDNSLCVYLPGGHIAFTVSFTNQFDKDFFTVSF